MFRTSDKPHSFTALGHSLESAYTDYFEGNGLKGAVDFNRLENDKAYAQEVLDRIEFWRDALDTTTDTLINREDLRAGNIVKRNLDDKGNPLARREAWMIDPGTAVTMPGLIRGTADNPGGYTRPPITHDIPIDQIIHGDSNAPYST